MLRGEVAAVYAADGAIAIFHDEVPDLLPATRGARPRELLVLDAAD